MHILIHNLVYVSSGVYLAVVKSTSQHSVQISHSVVSDSLRPHGLQHARLPRPSLTPGVYSNSCPSSWWCHPTISSSAVPFSSCPQSFPATRSFPTHQFFTSGGQSIGTSASASVLPMNTQDWSPLGWTGWISLQSMGLSRVFSRVWRKGNPLILLVGMQTSIATEQCGDLKKKTGNRTAIWSSSPTAGHTHRGNQNWKRHMYPNVHYSTVYIT